MQPVQIPAANHLVQAPPIAADSDPVPVRVIGSLHTTVWRPNEFELARLKAGHLITVTVYSHELPTFVGLGVASEGDLEMRSAAAG